MKRYMIYAASIVLFLDSRGIAIADSETRISQQVDNIIIDMPLTNNTPIMFSTAYILSQDNYAQLVQDNLNDENTSINQEDSEHSISVDQLEINDNPVVAIKQEGVMKFVNIPHYETFFSDTYMIQTGNSNDVAIWQGTAIHNNYTNELQGRPETTYVTHEGSSDITIVNDDLDPVGLPSVMQDGANNTVDFIMSILGRRTEAKQEGETNTKFIAVTGEGNNVKYRRGGDSYSNDEEQYRYNSIEYIEQIDDNSDADIILPRDYNFSEISQVGAYNNADIDQIGNWNKAYIYQTSASNIATIIQHGTSHSASIRQSGGSGNYAIIYQSN